VGHNTLGWALVLYTAEKTSAEQFKGRPGNGDTYTVEIVKSR
jgi:hypothetical protein